MLHVVLLWTVITVLTCSIDTSALFKDDGLIPHFQGLRGFASLLVVSAHLSRSFAPNLLSPAPGPGEVPLFFQWPVIRCLLMGRASVAIFAVLSGFVNALKPTAQLRGGNIDAALHGTAKAAYRRTGRFVLPTALATVCAWLICQFGAFNLAHNVDSAWIRDTSPWASESFAGAIRDLLYNQLTTWTTGANVYDRVQWTLTYLLRGSMFVYLSMFATSYLQPRYRMTCYVAMFGYYWALGDATIGINVYAGLIMAELQHDSQVRDWAERRAVLVSVMTTMAFALGLLCISYPEDHPEWAAWSDMLTCVGRSIFPAGAEFARFYPSVGAILICFGVQFNPIARRLLSRSLFCFLGRVSFAVYLLHAPLLRTILTWMLYGAVPRPASPGNDDHGNPLPAPGIPVCSPWAVAILIPMWLVLVYKIAALWCAYVEPMCDRFASRIEDRVFQSEERRLAEKVALQA